MTANTPINGLRIAELTDAPANIQTVMSNFGTDVDSRIVPRFTSTALRDAAITSPVENQIAAVAGTVHQVQVYDGAAWTELARRPLYVRKTATENVLNSTTLQDDNELLLPVKANYTYQFKMVFFNASGSTANLKYKFSVPSGTTMFYSSTHSFAGVLDSFYNTEGSTVVVGSSGSNKPVIVDGIILVSATAGNVTLQWAQNTATGAENSTVSFGSFFTAQRVG